MTEQAPSALNPNLVYPMTLIKSQAIVGASFDAFFNIKMHTPLDSFTLAFLAPTSISGELGGPL
jgi:hypothetical protein